MDESFLETLDSFRAELARSFKHRNAELGSEDLTEITQRTLDRLVFMRFLEDKLIESEPIVEALGDSGTAWQDFVSASRRLDGTYNGIIFKRHSILDSPSFRVDENVFEDVREHLAHTNSPYAFNYIPIHILGSIYERFLEKTIVTTDHRAEVKKKPEVRREGGVYYTPEYVVRYIVQQTVGKLIADKAPPDIRELRFADIACGSGSFLLAIYDSLLRRHAAYYNARGNKKKARNAGCIEAADGTFHLSLRQKREILVNNVFGVDIDPQAVEVAQLSLYLKLLEEETTASRRHYQLEFGEALLPNLSNNIRCGNSLVDWDFESDLFTGADEKHYRPFDFQAAFPEAFSRGGFDCIVGNPPYGMEADTSLKKYFDTKYDTVEGRYDRYEVFLERAYQLCREKGLVSYIIPSPFLTNVYTRQLRRYLLQNSDIEEIVNFSVPVFKDPTVHSCVVTLARRRSADHAIQIRKSVTSSAELSNDFDYSMPQNAALENPNSTIDIFVDAAATAILQKLERAGIALGTICYIRQCIKTGNDARYVQLAGRKPGREWKKSSRGRSIERYVTLESNLWVKYGSWLARNWANTSFYETPKIGVREAGNHIVATIDKENRYFLSSLYSVYPKAGIVLDLRLLLGILNSSVATYYIRKIAYELTQGAFTKIRTNQLARLPLPVDDSGRPRSDRLCRQVTMLVDRMLVAKNQLRIAESDRNRSLYEHKCAAIERRIDSAVAELYQLTHEERAVILRDVFGGQ
jgi:adenine-specific DNA-methyltransferase